MTIGTVFRGGDRRTGAWGIDRDDDIHLLTHEFCREPRKHVESSTGIAHDDGQIDRLLVTKPAQSLLEDRGLPSITCSARSSSGGGIVRPSVFAVFTLTTRLNLVGCSTGRSAGFAPLRILST